MIKEFLQTIPLKVKIASCIMLFLYILLLIVATPIAILLGLIGLGMWSTVTIINHIMK